MSNAQRLKGRRAEAEVAALLRAAGFTVRGLEAGGDHVAVGHGLTLHVEVKRQERGFRAAWLTQAVNDAPPGARPVVIYRRSRTPWAIAYYDGAGWRHDRLSVWLGVRTRARHEDGLTCPRCGDLSEWRGSWCAECGTRLGVLESARAQPHDRGTSGNRGNHAS